MRLGDGLMASSEKSAKVDNIQHIRKVLTVRLSC